MGTARISFGQPGARGPLRAGGLPAALPGLPLGLLRAQVRQKRPLGGLVRLQAA